jgi:hypothetical protein
MLAGPMPFQAWYGARQAVHPAHPARHQLGMVRAVVLRIDLPHRALPAHMARTSESSPRTMVQVAGPQQMVEVGLGSGVAGRPAPEAPDPLAWRCSRDAGQPARSRARPWVTSSRVGRWSTFSARNNAPAQPARSKTATPGVRPCQAIPCSPARRAVESPLAFDKVGFTQQSAALRRQTRVKEILGAAFGDPCMTGEGRPCVRSNVGFGREVFQVDP